MSLFTLNLNQDEELLTIIRRHSFTFLGHLLKFTIIIVVIVAIYWLIPKSLWRSVVMLTLGIIGLIFLLYNFIVWYLVSILVTNERIIDINQSSLNKRVVTEILISDIANVSSFREGFLQGFFNYGTIVIDIKGGGKIVGIKVKDPEGLMSKINKLKKDYDEILSRKRKRTGAK